MRLCFAHEPAPEELYLMLGYNVSAPPHVRQSLFARTVNNDDILPTIRKPVLITHGAADAILKPVATNQHKASITHAEIHMMDNVGHAPFWDDAATFNQRQRAFCATLSK